MRSTTMAIEFKAVRYCYPQHHAAVIDIAHWSVCQGERIFLHGPSGSGKTTLLHLITGILRPQSGQIALLNQPFSPALGWRRDAFRARHIGYVFQQFNLIGYLSVADNIALSGQRAGLSRAVLKQRIPDLMERLALPVQLRNQPAHALSVGQQQRVAVARALIHEPELLVADEPTSALDAQTRAVFMDTLLQQATQIGTTVIFVSHDRTLAHHFSRQTSLAELNQAVCSDAL